MEINESGLLAETGRLFSCPWPADFTDYRHCSECADYGQTLQANDRDSIGLKQLGKPAWDPVCFVDHQAFQ